MILRLLVPVFMESPVTVNGIAAEKLQQLGQNIFVHPNEKEYKFSDGQLPLQRVLESGHKATHFHPGGPPKQSAVSLSNGNKNANETEVAEKGSELRKQSEDDGFTAAKQSENSEDDGFTAAKQSENNEASS